MSTIKREDVMAALKDIMKPLKLDLSVWDAEYMVPCDSFCFSGQFTKTLFAQTFTKTRS